jgi:DNA polymerase III subunit epsilon
VTAYLSVPRRAVDTETTGISVETDRIVTACTALLRPNTPTWDQELTSHLIAVDMDIPDEATAVHGITTKFARDNGQPAAEVLDLVAADLARAMLAHIPVVVCNGVFDFTILDRELRRHGLPTVDERLGHPIRPVIDVLVLDKHIDQYRKGGRKLVDLCQHYGVTIAGAHDSTFDALAAARVAYRIGLLSRYEPKYLLQVYQGRREPLEVVDRLVALKGMALRDLHAAQMEWRRDQCDGLRAYFNSKGIEHDGVPGDWPVIPFVRAGEGVLVDG